MVNDLIKLGGFDSSRAKDPLSEDPLMFLYETFDPLKDLPIIVLVYHHKGFDIRPDCRTK